MGTDLAIQSRNNSSDFSSLSPITPMTPIHAAVLAVKGAGFLMKGIHSISQKSQAANQSAIQQPQQRAVPSRPNVSNAHSFAQIFQQQSGPKNSGKMAGALAKRLVRQTGRPMRTERMDKFTQQAQSAFSDLSNGQTNSSAINDLKKSLKDRLGLNDAQVDSVMSQMAELAKSPQAQERFIATEGASVDFV
jgi:hypothetical protein